MDTREDMGEHATDATPEAIPKLPRTYAPPHVIFGVAVCASSALGILSWFGVLGCVMPVAVRLLELAAMLAGISVMAVIGYADIVAWRSERMTVLGYVATGGTFAASSVGLTATGVIMTGWLSQAITMFFGACENRSVSVDTDLLAIMSVFVFAMIVVACGFAAFSYADDRFIMSRSMKDVACAHGMSRKEIFYKTLFDLIVAVIARPDYNDTEASGGKE